MLVTAWAVWHGTEHEINELVQATNRVCECTKDEASGKVTKRCEAHKALLDQRFLDGVLANRKRRADLLASEFRVGEFPE